MWLLSREFPPEFLYVKYGKKASALTIAGIPGGTSIGPRTNIQGKYDSAHDGPDDPILKLLDDKHDAEIK
jgi:hypothetical protein